MNLPLCVVTLYSLFTFEKKKHKKGEVEGRFNSRKISVKVKRREKKKKERDKSEEFRMKRQNYSLPTMRIRLADVKGRSRFA